MIFESKYLIDQLHYAKANVKEILIMWKIHRWFRTGKEILQYRF